MVQPSYLSEWHVMTSGCDVFPFSVFYSSTQTHSSHPSPASAPRVTPELSATQPSTPALPTHATMAIVPPTSPPRSLLPATVTLVCLLLRLALECILPSSSASPLAAADAKSCHVLRFTDSTMYCIICMLYASLYSVFTQPYPMMCYPIV